MFYIQIIKIMPMENREFPPYKRTCKTLFPGAEYLQSVSSRIPGTECWVLVL